MSKLKIEAENLIKELKLLDILKQYGKAGLVGSVPLDLIVKKDIDLHVFLKNKNLINNALELSKEILEISEINEIRLTDYRHINSFKIGIDNFNGWDIDLWLTIDLDKTGFENLKKYKSFLNPEFKRIIMNLKEYYHKQGLLEHGLSSKIYKAVFEYNIKTIKEFKTWNK